MDLAAAYLQFREVTKTFPGVRALEEVSFGVRERSVHALLGENGAGKSTLLKILSGAHRPTSGELVIGGRERVFRGTADAIAARVAVIYQELHLVAELSVAENLFLGHLPGAAGIIDKRKLRDSALGVLRRFGEEIDPRTKVGRLPIGQRQMIEIAKALSRGAKVIAFDEPTSSLSAREIEKLFAVVRGLRAAGNVILYVTHRMEEVQELCDAATVLRDGRHVRTWDSTDGVTHDVIVTAMVGRSLEDVYGYSPRPRGGVALRVEGLIGPGVAEPVTLEVARGEIVGLFGLVGAGRTELLKLIYGATAKARGRVEVCGRPVEIRAPRDAIRAGLLFCPEDRRREGIFPLRSVLENVNISVRRHAPWGGFLIHDRWERANAEKYIDRLGVRTPWPGQLIRNLSGGNQQKVILARWLSEGRVNAMLLDEPTRGIDVGAKSEIYSIIYDLARAGAGVLLVSSDLPEVLGVSDRLVVMRQGRMAGEVPRESATQEAVMRLALPISSARPPVGSEV